MSADSNMGFRGPPTAAALYDHHMLSFQSGAVASGRPPGSGMFGGGVVSSSMPAGVSGALLDPVPGLKRDSGLAAEWSLEEQVILREGLANDCRFASEPSIMKYIKIAAMLRDKTVRDVALRCRWMTKKDHGKRRKPEEQYAGKKMKDKKEKMVDTYPEIIPMLNSDMASYSLMSHHANHTDQFSCAAPGLYGPMWNLMGENTRVFGQIEANLATLKIRENIDLFCHTRNNIAAILNSMNEMPGIMSRMSSLPVSLNEQLLNTVLLGTNQGHIFGAQSGGHLKQEP